MRAQADWLVRLGLAACLVLTGCKQKEELAQASSSGDTTGQAVTSWDDADRPVADKIDLKILYAGHPDSVREKDFVGFLRYHFTSVETCDLAGFQESRSNGVDVTIMDYDGDGFKAPRPQVSERFARPLLTVGVVGAFIGGRLNLKTGYL